MADAFDYVVIGAGSAGCVLANRLTENPSTSVLLLEAGGEDDADEIHIPAAFPALFKAKWDWNYETVEQKHLGDRTAYWPRMRALGGCSSTPRRNGLPARSTPSAGRPRCPTCWPRSPRWPAPTSNWCRCAGRADRREDRVVERTAFASALAHAGLPRDGRARPHPVLRGGHAYAAPPRGDPGALETERAKGLDRDRTAGLTPGEEAEILDNL